MEHAISKHALAALALAASNDATRGAINGVHFATHHAETTDGHRLHRVTFTEPIGDGERNVTLDSATRAMKAHGTSRDPMRLNGTWQIGSGATVPADESGPQWPQTERVLPQGPFIAVDLNARFLRDACDAAILAAGKDTRNVFIRLSLDAAAPATTAVKVEGLQGGCDFLAIVMPIKL